MNLLKEVVNHLFKRLFKGVRRRSDLELAAGNDVLSVLDPVQCLREHDTLAVYNDRESASIGIVRRGVWKRFPPWVNPIF
ncbi:MAG: hypothetical protein ACRDLL_14230 [Solirubrobacterales bacterium]